MLVAPRVSQDAWTAAFAKEPAMSPWHLAQALIANSPLEPEVVAMMDSYGMDSYYKDLVAGAQNGGISMLSIQKSELSYFNGQKSIGLNDLTAAALNDSVPAHLDNARVWHQAYPASGSQQSLEALHIALGNLTAARTIVDAQILAGTEPAYWQVADLYLHQLEGNQPLESVGATTVALLQSIAHSGDYGAAQAQAWLEYLGLPQTEQIILPHSWHGPSHLKPAPATSVVANMLSAAPNPSNGAVYIMVQLPEGAEQAVLRVVDPLGRLIMEREVGTSNGIIEVNERGMTSGLYTAGLFVDGVDAARVKFEVIR